MTSQPRWWQPFRTIDDVDIFAIDLSRDADCEAAAVDLLDEHEKARHDRFKVAGARRQFLLSRAGLRVLLGDRLAIPLQRLSFDSGEFGKPYAVIDGVPAPVSFNVSHSGDDGLIAVTTSRSVGVDLEQRRPLADLDGVAGRVFGSEERAALSCLKGSAKIALFYKLWTCKEALIKAKGTGFSYDPIRFQIADAILNGGRTATFGFPEDETPMWVLTDLGTQDYAAALATRI